VGGIVPPDDEALLLRAGVARVFHPGSRLDEITACVRALAEQRRAASAA
jgi:methylmalonyl-CoA mutase cobalamin-binding domain/chain